MGKCNEKEGIEKGEKKCLRSSMVKKVENREKWKMTNIEELCVRCINCGYWTMHDIGLCQWMEREIFAQWIKNCSCTASQWRHQGGSRGGHGPPRTPPPETNRTPWNMIINIGFDPLIRCSGPPLAPTHICLQLCHCSNPLCQTT